MNVRALKSMFGFAPVVTTSPDVLTLQEQQLRRVLLAALAAGLITSGIDASAFTAPATGTLGYDVYNVVVNQLLTGPIGFVGGVVLIVWGATQVMKQWLVTVLCIIAGTVIIKAGTIVQSLGALAQ